METAVQGNSQATTAAATRENKVQALKKSLKKQQQEADTEMLVLGRKQQEVQQRCHRRDKS